MVDGTKKKLGGRMAGIWNRLFGKRQRPTAALTLLDYAENYLFVV
jgi:hypothetical protein